MEKKSCKEVVHSIKGCFVEKCPIMNYMPLQLAAFVLLIIMIVLTVWMIRFLVKKFNDKLVELLEKSDEVNN